MQKAYDFMIIKTIEISGHSVAPDGYYTEGNYYHKKTVVHAFYPDLPAAQKAAEPLSDSEQRSRCRFEGTTYTIQMFPKGTVAVGEVVSEEGC